MSQRVSCSQVVKWSSRKVKESPEITQLLGDETKRQSKPVVGPHPCSCHLCDGAVTEFPLEEPGVTWGPSVNRVSSARSVAWSLRNLLTSN